MRALLVAALLLAACADESPDVAETPATVAATRATPVTADGWGPLQIGMTRAEVVAALGDDETPDAVGGPDPAACDEFRPSRAPEGLLVMVEDGVLTRVSVLAGSGLRTDAGFGVGSGASSVKVAYGDAADVSPHKYLDAPAEYVTVWRAGDGGPGSRGLRYETDLGGRVAAIRAGGPSIAYVEGCF
ncbi:hypothetical protein [Rubrivirga sp.]|uniref:hypothetical protein n=1 Tax=Rubrivirga sp. TaxID=1885344 RepID=UPI003B52061C